MRLFSEDRKQKTDQLLLTAPISTKEIVFGKYFAAFGIFMVGVLITLIYPVILAFTGNFADCGNNKLLCRLYTAMFGNTCYRCVYVIYYGSQIVAAVATYGVLIFTLLLGSVASNVSNEIIVKILLWLSPVQRFSDFTLGILNLNR